MIPPDVSTSLPTESPKPFVCGLLFDRKVIRESLLEPAERRLEAMNRYHTMADALGPEAAETVEALWGIDRATPGLFARTWLYFSGSIEWGEFAQIDKGVAIAAIRLVNALETGEPTREIPEHLRGGDRETVNERLRWRLGSPQWRDDLRLAVTELAEILQLDLPGNGQLSPVVALTCSDLAAFTAASALAGASNGDGTFTCAELGERLYSDGRRPAQAYARPGGRAARRLVKLGLAAETIRPFGNDRVRSCFRLTGRKPTG